MNKQLHLQGRVVGLDLGRDHGDKTTRATVRINTCEIEFLKQEIFVPNVCGFDLDDQVTVTVTGVDGDGA